MSEGTGFKLIAGFILVAVALLLWLPLNDTVGLVVNTFNNISTGNATYDAQMIAHNNNVASLFSAFPIFLLFVYGVYVIKSALGERGGGVILQ